MAQRVLITRPIEDAAALTQLLLSRGCDVVHAPMLSIHFLSRTIDIADVQAVLITSANGARALAAATAVRSVSVFSVGKASGRACQEHGFNDVIMAGGALVDLIRLVKNRLRPENGALLHVAGSVSAGDLSGELRQAGFVIRKTILYESRPTTTFAKSKSQLIADGAIDAALFYSPRTAAIFSTLVGRAGVSHGLAVSRAYCLSEAVRSQLSELPWQLVRVSPVQTQESLLETFDRDQNKLSLQKESSAENHMTRHKSQESSMSNVWNTQNPRPVNSLEADPPNKTSVLDETIRAPVDNAQKVSEEKKSYRSLAARLIGAILLVVMSVFIGWISQPLWRDFMPDTYRFYVSPKGNNSLKMDLQKSLLSLRDDLSEVVLQLDEQQKNHKILEQYILTQEKSNTVSREINLPINSNNILTYISKSLFTLENAIEQLTNTETRRLESLTQQITALDSRLNSVSARIDAIAREQVTAVTFAEVHDRLTVLEKDIANFNSTDHYDTSPKWLLSLTQLRDAIDRGTPFTAELHAARSLAENAAVVDQAVTGFIAYAATGLPTSSSLKNRFEKLHRTIARAAPSLEEDSWLGRILHRMQWAITIRRTDGSTVATSDREDTLIVMAKANTALNAGDFLGAIRMMESLRGKPAQAAAGWMAFARARAAADEALSRLTAHALGHVTTAGHAKE